MRKLIAQMIKFGFVGALCFFIDYGIMIFLTEIFGVVYIVSSGISFSVSVIVNYVLSIRFVFDADKDANKIKEFLVFLILSIIGLGINQLVMWIGVDFIHIDYKITKLGATGIVMVYNFITRKLFIEKHD